MIFIYHAKFEPPWFLSSEFCDVQWNALSLVSAKSAQIYVLCSRPVQFVYEQSALRNSVFSQETSLGSKKALNFFSTPRGEKVWKLQQLTVFISG